MLREDIRELLFGARLLIFLLAMTRRQRSPLRVRTERPLSTPPGFRRPRTDVGAFRKLKRVVRLRGRTVHARLAELRAMFDTLSAWADRVLKHVRAGGHGARIVLCWMLADGLSPVLTPMPSIADSS